MKLRGIRCVYKVRSGVFVFVQGASGIVEVADIRMHSRACLHFPFHHPAKTLKQNTV